MVFDMKLKIFSIYDSKAWFFGNPFFDHREGNVIRGFSDAVNSSDPSNGYSKHPEDYSLYLLGEFDTDSGEFDIHKPKNLVTASALKQIINPEFENKNKKNELVLN